MWTSQSHSNNTLCVQVIVHPRWSRLKKKNTGCKIWCIQSTFPLLAWECLSLVSLKARGRFEGFAPQVQVLTTYIKRSQATSTLTITESYRNVCVCLLAGVTSSEANSVGASCRIVDGRAGGLGHSPFIPHLLPVVAAPESHCDIIITRYGDGLL